MFNLLPPNASKALRREYHTRMVVVFLFLWVATSIILLVLSLPDKVLVSVLMRSYNTSISSHSDQSTSIKTANAEVSLANTEAAELARTDALPDIAPLYKILYGLTGSDVTVDSMSLIRNAKDGTVGTITVSGTAATRESLVAFRDRIEATDAFSSATLPLSNLAKDKDVPFTISIAVYVPKSSTKTK